jgi:sterol 3beta-glucosyltransferase
MTITILTSGSRGDTQPYIALALALKKTGYQVRLAAFENYASFVEEFGLEFFPITGDVTQVLASEKSRDALQADNPLKFIRSFNTLKTFIFDIQTDFFEACQESQAIVYHPGVPIGFFAAQSLKIPSIFASPFPMTPTRDYPALIFYNYPRLGKYYNRITHQIFEKIMWFPSSSPIKKFWRQKFGHLPDRFKNPFTRQATATSPTIISCSNHVFTKPADFPEHVYNTGYWFLDHPENWQPPVELSHFLQSGPPPVYVGFGSVGDATQAAQTTELVIQALKRSGKRGVLATGWHGMAKIGHPPENIFILESAPHSWLFPRMAAVIHHGGAGTTAEGFRAGVPQAIIPHGADQFAWGQRVFELGVGAQSIPRKKLTVEKLSEAIQSIAHPEIISAAQALGQKVRSENGAHLAAQIIVKCLIK